MVHAKAFGLHLLNQNKPLNCKMSLVLWIKNLEQRAVGRRDFGGNLGNVVRTSVFKCGVLGPSLRRLGQERPVLSETFIRPIVFII